MLSKARATVLSHHTEWVPEAQKEDTLHKITQSLVGDFPGGPVVKNPPYKAGVMGLVPGQGTKIPCATGQPSLCTASKIQLGKAAKTKKDTGGTQLGKAASRILLLHQTLYLHSRLPAQGSFLGRALPSPPTKLSRRLGSFVPFGEEFQGSTALKQGSSSPVQSRGTCTAILGSGQAQHLSAEARSRL